MNTAGRFKYALQNVQLQKKSIPTPSMEDHWKIPRGRGVLKVKILEAKYEAKLEFPGGTGGAKQKTFRGGSMDIFWNCTINKLHHKRIHHNTQVI